mgnify:CR=1 FL=1
MFPRFNVVNFPSEISSDSKESCNAINFKQQYLRTIPCVYMIHKSFSFDQLITKHCVTKVLQK